MANHRWYDPSYDPTRRRYWPHEICCCLSLLFAVAFLVVIPLGPTWFLSAFGIAIALGVVAGFFPSDPSKFSPDF